MEVDDQKPAGGRLIDAVDVDHSQTLDFNEFLSLLLVYRQTDGFSHKDLGEQGSLDDGMPKQKKQMVEAVQVTSASLFGICIGFLKALMVTFSPSFGFGRRSVKSTAPSVALLWKIPAAK